MNPALLLVLSAVMCALPISELAEDASPKSLSRMDLYQEGERADQERDYVTAFRKLSAFSKVNSDRLTAATTYDEIAFRNWLETRLKQLSQVIRQNRTYKENVGRGISAQDGNGQTSHSTSISANSNSDQFSGAGKSAHVPMPTPPPPNISTGGNSDQFSGASKSTHVPMPTPPPPSISTGGNTDQFTGANKSTHVPPPPPPPPGISSGGSTGQFTGASKSTHVPMPTPPPPHAVDSTRSFRKAPPHRLEPAPPKRININVNVRH
jgi:hypothetical protein